MNFIAQFFNHRFFMKDLTHREKEIIKLILDEYTNKELAAKLSISERTVESHRKNIFRKTNSRSIVGLVKYALKNNLDK